MSRCERERATNAKETVSAAAAVAVAAYRAAAIAALLAGADNDKKREK